VFTLTTINAWSRFAITMRTEVGNYQPKARQSPKPLKIGICLSQRCMDHFRIARNPGTISPMGPRSEMSYCDDL
jgi:hypothetical protein